MKKSQGLKKQQQESVTLQTSGRPESKPTFVSKQISEHIFSQTDRQSASSLRTVSPSAIDLWNELSSLSTETIQRTSGQSYQGTWPRTRLPKPLRHGHHPRPPLCWSAKTPQILPSPQHQPRRWALVGPWLKTLLSPLHSIAAVSLLPISWDFWIIDGLCQLLPSFPPLICILTESFKKCLFL